MYSRILNGSLNTHLTFWQHFISFIFLYSYQSREGSVHSHATTASRVLSTEHNKSAVFIRVINTTTFFDAYSPKGALAIKKE